MTAPTQRLAAIRAALLVTTVVGPGIMLPAQQKPVTPAAGPARSLA